MAQANVPFVAFNQGMISSQAIARIDQARNRFAAEQQENWFPRAVGSMMLRPGLGYLDTTKSNLQTYPIPFVRDLNNTAILEFVGGVMRVRINDVLVSRASVLTAFNDFTSPGSWTTTATTGATCSIGGGSLSMHAQAIGSISTAYQSATIAVVDRAVEHAIHVTVAAGPVYFQIGSTQGAADIVGPYTLGTGDHSLAFTPNTGTVYVQLQTSANYAVSVSHCYLESSGTVEITSPYANADLPYLRYAQSADVVYLACNGTYQQYKAERRSTTSWSLVKYETTDGPFMSVNVTDATITPSQQDDDITLTSNRNIFKPGHVGALFRIFTSGQYVNNNLAGASCYSDAIRVTGVGADRSFSWSIAGTWVGTVTLQRSWTSATAGFVNFQSNTVNGASSVADGLDNDIVWYRFGFNPGGYTSGLATVTLGFNGGGGPGIARVLTYTDAQHVQARVLKRFTNSTASSDWNEGSWSSVQGFPSAASLYQGRLWWFGQDKILGSVSDAFESFDYDAVGDSAPLNRSIGYGPLAVVQWSLPMQRLLVGLQLSEASIRSTAFDEPITPTNFSVKDCSTQGSSQVDAVRVDSRGIYVQRSARRVYELLFSIDDQDYISVDQTALLPDLDSDFVQVVVQRQPDTRVHCLRADGTVLVLLLEPQEKVVCWYKVSTVGTIERMVVLPGNAEDRVYYYCNRNGTRTVEKYALISECQGGTLNKQADCFILYSNVPDKTLTGIPTFLNGQQVVVWGDGKDQGTYTVSAGTVTLPNPVGNAVIGLPYMAKFKSAKLAFIAQKGTALNQKKRVNHLGLVLYNTHAQGLQFGQDFTNMDNLPLMKDGAPVDTTQIYASFDQPAVSVPGRWDTDARLCLQGTAPRPVTVLGCSISLDENER